MKVLVINCGSSSLKYQLIDMDGEKVLCKGLCERIGMESSMITHEANGHKATTPAIFPTHTEAFAEVVKKMTTGEGKCINDDSEITLEVESRSHNFLVAIDGRSEKLLESTRLTIRKAPYTINIVKRDSRSYFSTLREKMMWGADHR